jgi:hypothetical protein
MTEIREEAKKWLTTPAKMKIFSMSSNLNHIMNMKKELPSILGACLALIGTATADTITWTGSSGSGNGVSLFETNNWDNPGDVITVSNFKDVPVAHDFIINSSTDTVGGGGGVGGVLDLGGTGSLTVTDPNGGTAGGELRLGAGAILKNGTISVTGSNFNFIQGTLDNADFTSNWGLSLAGAMHLTNGSSLEATWFAGGNGISTLNGGSTLTIREDGATTFNNNIVNFLDFDSTIVYSNLGRTITKVESEHLSKFTVNGEAAVLGININIFTNGDGFTTVQAVPEPQTAALISGMLALTAIMIRRRKG